MQNETLQSKVDELTIDNTRLRQDEYELERLRDLYKLDQNYSDYAKNRCTCHCEQRDELVQ